jgi:hypothetical protein
MSSKSTVHIDSFDARSLTTAQLNEFYQLSNSLMAEALPNFLRHCQLQDRVYVFRDDQQSLIGFNFWRTMDTSDANVKLMVQGKLRLLAQYRRRALHWNVSITIEAYSKWKDDTQTIVRTHAILLDVCSSVFFNRFCH